MSYDGPWGGHNNFEPESGPRLVVVLVVIGLLLAAGFTGYLSGNLAFGLVGYVFAAWLWVEYEIENQMQRDLATDLSQAIHDGYLEGEDLRRARGYAFVEDALERADGSGAEGGA